MAWPTPDLEDVILSYDTGGKRWLHALCLAVNERQNGLGMALTQFNKGDGSTGWFLDLEDFTGLWIGGPNDGAITNLNLCMTAIKAMLLQSSIIGSISRFLEEPGYGATGWTLSSLQADIGLGSFPNECDGWTDLNFWKQMKEALDRMIYCRYVAAASAGTLTHQESESTGFDDETALEIAWDEAKADGGERPPPSHTPWSELQVGWFRSGFRSDAFSSSSYIFLRSDGRCNFTCPCQGTMDEAYYVVTARAGSTLSPAWEIDPTSGDPISVSDNFTGHVLGPDLDFTSNQTDYTYTGTVPADYPDSFASGGLSPPPFYGAFTITFASLDMGYADFYFQPTLTDQA